MGGGGGPQEIYVCVWEGGGRWGEVGGGGGRWGEVGGGGGRWGEVGGGGGSVRPQGITTC